MRGRIYPPISNLMTTACSVTIFDIKWYLPNIADSTEYDYAIRYGQPLFALMQQDENTATKAWEYFMPNATQCKQRLAMPCGWDLMTNYLATCWVHALPPFYCQWLHSTDLTGICHFDQHIKHHRWHTCRLCLCQIIYGLLCTPPGWYIYLCTYRR